MDLLTFPFRTFSGIVRVVTLLVVTSLGFDTLNYDTAFQMGLLFHDVVTSISITCLQSIAIIIEWSFLY